MPDPARQHDFAVYVTGKLREAGHEAFWAGGCVRDRLLRRTPKDYDVATDAEPEQVQELFGRRKTLALGAAFGVITVLGKKAEGQIEVATFRQDTTYSDGRHPDAVIFTSAEEDAKRRDFTINGLFYDPLADRIIDFVGGQDDLKRGVIRAIGKARLRFEEDKLRMLRAVRFAATFGFSIEEATLAAIQQMAGELQVVSAERIAAELRRMLTGDGRRRATELLYESRLLPELLPDDVAIPKSESREWQDKLVELDALEDPEFSLATASLLAGICNLSQSKAVCNAWKLSNAEESRIVWLVKHRRSLDEADRDDWPKIQRLLIHDGAGDLVNILAARRAAGTAAGNGLEFCRERLAWPTGKLNPEPLITGDDLIEHGIPPGRRYPKLLEAVRDAQLDGEIASKEEALQLVDRLQKS